MLLIIMRDLRVLPFHTHACDELRLGPWEVRYQYVYVTSPCFMSQSKYTEIPDTPTV